MGGGVCVGAASNFFGTTAESEDPVSKEEVGARETQAAEHSPLSSNGSSDEVRVRCFELGVARHCFLSEEGCLVMTRRDRSTISRK